MTTSESPAATGEWTRADTEASAAIARENVAAIMAGNPLPPYDLAPGFEPVDPLWPILAYMQLSFGQVGPCAFVCFSDEAFKHIGQILPNAVRLTWPELQAVADGVREVEGADRRARLLEALNYFAARDGLPAFTTMARGEPPLR